MPAATIELVDTSFPGRPALDVGVSRALLREVADGKRSETLRLYRPDDVVAFSTTDLRQPGLPAAIAAARAQGFDVALRLVGGRAALFQRESLAFAWCVPEADGRAGIRERFARTADWVVRALRRLGVDARVGEVPGAYCPGDFSVNASGRRKLMGLGQRIVRGAVHTGGVLSVAASARTRAVLEPVYAALGFEYDPASTGSVEDELDGIGLDAVRDALLAELAPWRTRPGAIGPSTLEMAERLEASHRLG